MPGSAIPSSGGSSPTTAYTSRSWICCIRTCRARWIAARFSSPPALPPQLSSLVERSRPDAALLLPTLVADDLGLPGKPSPDTFLEAARRLDTTAARAVVVEDAVVGVEAGRLGGFGFVIGVDGEGDPDRLMAHGADVVVDDLGDLVAV